MKNSKNRNQRQSPLKTKSHLGIHILICFICGVFCMAILLCLLAELLCKIDVPQRYLSPLTSVVLCISTLAAALIFARMQGKAGLLSGALWGVGFYVLLLLIAWTQNAVMLQEASFLRLGSMVIAGGLGGYLGMLLQEKKRKIH
ncbi:MAG: TIGR04086 family membrane protein [Ruthenibacterium sp.]